MKKKKKHFLVTGGMGFIGSAICGLLINQGYKITIFDDGSRGNINKNKDIEKKLTIINGDVRNFDKLNSLHFYQLILFLAA